MGQTDSAMDPDYSSDEDGEDQARDNEGYSSL